MEETPSRSDGGAEDLGGGEADVPEPDGGGRVTRRLSLGDVAAADAPVTSAGDPIPVAFAPGVVIVHAADFQPFIPGTAATAALGQLSGDGDNRTGDLRPWDTGTEVNEEPGAGPNRPSHQASPGDGTPEGV